MAIINFRPKTTSISNNISSREEYERVKMQRACIPPSLNLPSFYINCFFLAWFSSEDNFLGSAFNAIKLIFWAVVTKNTSEFTTTDIQISSTRRLQPTNSSLIIILIIWECHHVISQLRLSSVFPARTRSQRRHSVFHFIILSTSLESHPFVGKQDGDSCYVSPWVCTLYDEACTETTKLMQISIRQQLMVVVEESESERRCRWQRLRM